MGSGQGVLKRKHYWPHVSVRESTVDSRYLEVEGTL